MREIVTIVKFICDNCNDEAETHDDIIPADWHMLSEFKFQISNYKGGYCTSNIGSTHIFCSVKCLEVFLVNKVKKVAEESV